MQIHPGASQGKKIRKQNPKSLSFITNEFKTQLWLLDCWKHLTGSGKLGLEGTLKKGYSWEIFLMVIQNLLAVSSINFCPVCQGTVTVGCSQG